jgi:PhnB protein
MLIPHFHFNGDCKEAIALYEKAFNAKASEIDMSDNEKIAHARMEIHGQLVFLNDRFGNKDKSLDCAVHMILTFKTSEDLQACYEALKDGSTIIDPFHETPYSALVGNFMDRFGVLWGFMVGND